MSRFFSKIAKITRSIQVSHLFGSFTRFGLLFRIFLDPFSMQLWIPLAQDYGAFPFPSVLMILFYVTSIAEFVPPPACPL